MELFRSFIKSIANIFLGLAIFISIVFLGLITYIENPLLFTEEHIDPDTWQPKDVEAIFASGFMDSEVAYGYLIISETSENIGPMAEEHLQYAGNNLSCSHCHLKFGTQAGSGSWVGVVDRFPQFRGRENRQGTIEDRINGCMERSMNGKKLPKDSKEMEAIVAYMTWLGEDLPEERIAEFKGFPQIKIPNKSVDLEKGESLFAKECAICHGENGQGKKFTAPQKGYQYPPLWGADSFNDGAGMHRVITAAEFIKSNMPFGQATWDNPKLTDEEAYHLAGYINSFSRPHKSNTENDFPDRKLKPVSTPYGPWADNFPAEQHKFGPFPPIIDFYKKQFDLEKTK